MKFRFFLISFIILFLLSFATGFPNAPFSHVIISSDSGKGETYGLELVSLLINFMVAVLVAIAVTVSWFYFKNRRPAVDNV
jgi:hypothetical protein